MFWLTTELITSLGKIVRRKQFLNTGQDVILLTMQYSQTLTYPNYTDFI